ncbi:hypothetical protein E4U22_000758 [Claviceps purpurea]|nr:hypothetical protein E4U28_007339 [Claviceps purpurea]KAG6170055.1 hypothetical protein E4U51_001187 [Claviceps purpurea]KAG6196407.1 hypothetical protein E4U10_001020 [Claviceps purpurea]KAG6227353.1 hypothetical protein E4U26_001751 [Claviceps purpurea]KAG6239568.1 hypothetical protein E4U25_000586 [Claviceps purpurea]
MVQVAPLIGAVIVAITSVAQAGACTPGLIYCGSTLSRLGYDDAKITEAAQAAFLPEQYKRNAVYTCNADGDIAFKEACLFFCVDEGGGNNDRCQNYFN